LQWLFELIGHGNLIGIIYIFSAIFCFYCSYSLNQLNRRQKLLFASEARLWLFLGLGLLSLLCVNQADIWTGITQAGRDVARREGWYRDKDAVQAIAVMAAAIIGFLTSLMVLAYVYHMEDRWLRVATPAFVLLTSFALIKAVSVHAIDGLLAKRLYGVSLNFALEFGLLVAVIFCAWKSKRHAQRR
jgi:hypothetical protein